MNFSHLSEFSPMDSQINCFAKIKQNFDFEVEDPN
jgi:hypothetical protein